MQERQIIIQYENRPEKENQSRSVCKCYNHVFMAGYVLNAAHPINLSQWEIQSLNFIIIKCTASKDSTHKVEMI